MILMMSMVTGCLQSDHSDVEMAPWENNHLFGNFTVEAKRVDDTYLWDVTYEITDVIWEERRPRWEGSTVTISYYAHAQFDFVHHDLVPEPERIATDPLYYYIEANGFELGPDPGDSIVLANLNRTHDGARFEIGDRDFRLDWRQNTPNNESFNLTLSEQQFVNPDINEGTWDVVVEIVSIEPAWERVPWEWLRITPDFDRGISRAIPQPYPGDDAVNRTSPRWYYVDVGARDGVVGPGDQLRAAGLTVSYDEARVHINIAADSAAHFRFPEWFPFVGGSCDLDLDEHASRTAQTTTYNDFVYTVTKVDATDGDIPWKQTFITLDDGLRHSEFGSMNQNHKYVGSPWGWAIDRDGDGFISVDDQVHLTGLSAYYIGDMLYIERRGMAVGGVRLPLIFHGEYQTIRLTWSSVSSDETPNGPRFDVGLGVEKLSPRDVIVEWKSVNVTIRGYDRKTVLVPRFPVSGKIDLLNDSLQCVFSEPVDPDGLVSSGDVLYVLGFDSTLLGSFITLDLNGFHLATIILPRGVEEPDRGNFTINIPDVILDAIAINGTTLRVVTMMVQNTTGEEAPVMWSQVILEIIGWNGTVLESGMRLLPYSPDDTGDWYSFNTEVLTAWHIDSYGESGFLDEGDSIGLTGISETYAGSRLIIHIDGHLAFETILPGSFSMS
jgi:hypothetical protein